MSNLSGTLGVERCSYSIKYYACGSVTTARNERTNTCIEVISNDHSKRVEIYYNKDFGQTEMRKEIGYHDYINYIEGASKTAIIEVIEGFFDV